MNITQISVDANIFVCTQLGLLEIFQLCFKLIDCIIARCLYLEAIVLKFVMKNL